MSIHQSANRAVTIFLFLIIYMFLFEKICKYRKMLIIVFLEQDEIKPISIIRICLKCEYIVRVIVFLLQIDEMRKCTFNSFRSGHKCILKTSKSTSKNVNMFIYHFHVVWIVLRDRCNELL